MNIGIDLDNTIAIYDQAFIKYAELLLGIRGYKNKVEIANHLRNSNQASDWTYLQGEVYGKYMFEANVAEQFLETLIHPDLIGFQIEIVSHRTKNPSSGAGYDMHAIANEWLHTNIFSVLKTSRNIPVYFFETFEEKLRFIALKNYVAFVDDLRDVLMSPIFPACTKGILYKSKDTVGQFQGPYSEMDAWGNLIKLLK